MAAVTWGLSLRGVLARGSGAVAVACLLMALAAQAQTAPKGQSPAPAAKPQRKPLVAAPTSRVEARSLASQMASGIEAADQALTPEELELASRVQTGSLPCELGNTVSVVADAAQPGYFTVEVRGQRFRMSPVATATGAVRLEDRRAGAVWLQLANKSMLLNQKQGRRMADECKSPAQAAVAEALRLQPAPSILDAPPALAMRPSSAPAVVAVPADVPLPAAAPASAP